jgi:toxin ParE1/3/4
MSRCRLSPQALQDLDQISSYFAKENVEAGERLLNLFTEKCTRLMSFPNMGKSYDYLDTGVRGIPLEGYIIFHKVVDAEIIILRVISGRQSLDTVFNPDE